MTDEEFDQIVQDLRDRKARTSFPAIDAEEDYEAHGHHAEFAAAAH